MKNEVLTPMLLFSRLQMAEEFLKPTFESWPVKSLKHELMGDKCSGFDAGQCQMQINTLTFASSFLNQLSLGANVNPAYSSRQISFLLLCPDTT
jgi:hypothetical protein